MLTSRPLEAVSLVVLIGLIVGGQCLRPPRVKAIDISTGPVKGRLDSTVSSGIAVRVVDRDPDLVGQTNGGNAFTADIDDGNLNFDQWDVTSLNVKVLHELELGWQNYSFFGRFYYFYDWAIMAFDPNFMVLWRMRKGVRASTSGSSTFTSSATFRSLTGP